MMVAALYADTVQLNTEYVVTGRSRDTQHICFATLVYISFQFLGESTHRQNHHFDKK